MKKALVTGGGGFLGRALSEMLQDRGWSVQVINRSSYPDLEARGIQCLQGDLRDYQTVLKACEGMDVVFHVAAIAGIWGAKELYWSVNVDGTDNIINACREAKVAKLIYTSSPSVVYGLDDNFEGEDESLPYPEEFLTHYPASKAEGEKRVLAANDSELATCALRPHLIWGPKDQHLIPRLVEAAQSGRLRRVGDGKNRVDVTYVENAALAHVLAEENLEVGSVVAGQSYFIGDESPVNMWDWVDDVLELLGEKKLSKSISYKKARLIGAFLEKVYNILPIKGEPPMTRFVAAQFARSHFFSHAKAERDFGYKPAVSNDEGFKRLSEWYEA